MPAQKRVLVVEDDRVIKSSLQRVLATEECQIDSAATAQEGLLKFNQDPYDFVLTDLKLPDMDGIEMVAQMRRRAADLPFVVLSAYAEKEDALRALKMGALEFFQKPFDVQQVLNVARNFVQADRQVSPTVKQIAELSGKLSELVMKTDSQEMRVQDNLSSELLRLHGLLAPFVSLGRFGSGITHNLNGHLTGLIGHLDLLKMKHPELGQELAGILELARKIRDSIGEISSKYDNETVREAQPQNINQILRFELGFLKADLFYKHYMQVETEFQEPLPNVFGIYADFALAFEEIMLNAIDAQRNQKAGWIKIKTYAQDQNICVEFEDKGPGFSSEALQKAVNLLQPQTKTTSDGLVRGGVGLYFSQLWLEPWGGSIALENRAEGGARVRVTLPKRDRMPELKH